MDIRKSLSFLFEEKNRLEKFAIISIPMILLVIMQMYMDLSQPLTIILHIPIIIFLLLVSFWYISENTKASIEQRNTKLLREQNFKNIVLNSIKLIAVNLIYPLGIFLIVILVLLILVFILQFLGLRTDVARSLGFLLGSSFLFIVIGISTFITLPAQLIYISTDSIKEAFKVKRIITIASKNFIKLLLFSIRIYMLQFLFFLVLIVILTVIVLITRINIETGSFGYLLLGILTTIPATYLFFFTIPHLQGQLWRNLKK